MDVGTNVTLCGTNSNDPQLFSIEKKNLFDDVWYQKHWGDNIADVLQAYRKMVLSDKTTGWFIVSTLCFTERDSLSELFDYGGRQIVLSRIVLPFTHAQQTV